MQFIKMKQKKINICKKLKENSIKSIFKKKNKRNQNKINKIFRKDRKFYKQKIDF